MNKDTNEIERKQLEKSLRNLKDLGLIDYKIDDEDKLTIEFNLRAKLDAYSFMGNIPFPVHLYDKLKTHKDLDFDESLSVLLGIYHLIYSENGMNLDLLPPIPPETEPNPLIISLISEGYNLYEPVINFQNPSFYWFMQKQDYIKKLEEFANKQDMRKFTRYFV